MSAEAMESTRITILLRGEMRLSRHKLRAKAIGPPNIAGATITATNKASDSITRNLACSPCYTASFIGRDGTK